jgi:hypothetical protein
MGQQLGPLTCAYRWLSHCDTTSLLSRTACDHAINRVVGDREILRM